MKFHIVTMFVFLLLAVPAIAEQTADDAGVQLKSDVTGYSGGVPVWDGPKDVLWDNGPIITSIGTGVGGADESILDVSESTNGFGCQWNYEIKLADDFEVPAGEVWEINSITIFGYQTGSGPPSTITACYIELFDGPPETGTSVYGDLFTDILTSTEWMNCYRVNEAGSGNNTERPIMVNICEFSTPITLSEGTYFICWQLLGSADSGPWTPPITINGQLDTGDAVQYYQNVWDYIVDTTSGINKGLPFILEGSVAGALENKTWADVKTLF